MKAFTYFAYCPVRDLVKIGQSNSPKDRIATLAKGQKLDLLWVAKSERLTEKAAHQMFAEHRQRGEWFDVAPDAVKRVLFVEGIEDASAICDLKPKACLLKAISFRLPKHQVKALDDLAKQTHRTRGDMIRLALDRFADRLTPTFDGREAAQ